MTRKCLPIAFALGAILVLCSCIAWGTGFMFSGEPLRDLSTLADAVEFALFLSKNALLSPSTADLGATSREVVALLRGDVVDGSTPSNIGLLDGLQLIQGGIDQLALPDSTRWEVDRTLRRIVSLLEATEREMAAIADASSSDPETAMLRAYAYIAAALGSEGLTSHLPGILTVINLLPNATITVLPGESLQSAIDDLLPGGTLLLASGIHEIRGTLRIEKSVTIETQTMGQSPTEIRAMPAQPPYPAIHITNDSDSIPIQVQLSSLTIANARDGIIAGDIFWGPIELTLKDVTLEACLRAGLALSGAAAVLEACAIRDNGELGVVASRGARAILESCTITANGSLEYARASYRITSGIHVVDDAAVTLSNCSIDANLGSGIRAENQSAVHVKHSSINENLLDGILMWDKTTLELDDSRVLGNQGMGIRFHASECEILPDEFTGRHFVGQVSGRGNTIPAPGDPHANALGSVCPEAYVTLARP